MELYITTYYTVCTYGVQICTDRLHLVILLYYVVCMQLWFGG